MNNKKINLIVSSPYIRVIQTIEEIANNQDIEIKVYEELRERHLKGANKLIEDEIQQSIKTSYEDIDFHLTDGESIRDVQNRAIPVIKNLIRDYWYGWHGKRDYKKSPLLL